MHKSSARMTLLLAAGDGTGLEEGCLQHPTTGSGATQEEREERMASEVDEERAMLLRRMEDPQWRLDRGAGFYALQRERLKLPSLVQTGRHAGRSRVKVTGISWFRVLEHKIRRDFFNSAVNAPLHTILMALAGMYFGAILFWSLTYYTTWRLDDTCFTGFDSLVSAFLFAVETQNTIGYGTRAPGECWVTFGLVAMHALVTVVLNSLILGITFARISHPKNRGRTILMSDCAVVARRDGELKFMFRVADIQRRSVTLPVVRALLFSWGPGRQGRLTAEGERVPIMVHELPLTGLDPSLLLPVTLEHAIDERSPLWGHTQHSLEAMCAEVVVLFSATSEMGDNFTVRQSYLPSEIHWGYTFTNIIHGASEGSTQHSINIAQFHDIEPQPGLDLVPPHKLAAKVMSGGDRGMLPAPLPATNTLVLSEVGVVCARGGRFMLMFRVGDVFPGGQVLDVKVTAFLWRWQTFVTPEGEMLPFTVQELELEPAEPCLRYPATVRHALDSPGSPLSSWTSAAAKRLDSDSEVMVIARGVCATTGLPMVRQRVYPVLAGIRWGAMFLPMITPPAPGVPAMMRAKAGVNWAAFHVTAPAQMDMDPSSGGTNLPTQLGARALSRTPSWVAMAGQGQFCTISAPSAYLAPASQLPASLHNTDGATARLPQHAGLADAHASLPLTPANQQQGPPPTTSGVYAPAHLSPPSSHPPGGSVRLATHAPVAVAELDGGGGLLGSSVADVAAGSLNLWNQDDRASLSAVVLANHSAAKAAAARAAAASEGLKQVLGGAGPGAGGPALPGSSRLHRSSLPLLPTRVSTEGNGTIPGLSPNSGGDNSNKNAAADDQQQHKQHHLHVTFAVDTALAGSAATSSLSSSLPTDGAAHHSLPALGGHPEGVESGTRTRVQLPAPPQNEAAMGRQHSTPIPTGSRSRPVLTQRQQLSGFATLGEQQQQQQVAAGWAQVAPLAGAAAEHLLSAHGSGSAGVVAPLLMHQSSSTHSASIAASVVRPLLPMVGGPPLESHGSGGFHHKLASTRQGGAVSAGGATAAAAAGGGTAASHYTSPPHPPPSPRQQAQHAHHPQPGAGTLSPWTGRSADNTLLASQPSSDHTTGSDNPDRKGGPQGWQQTRSLFAAMEEMAKLMASEEQQQQQQR